VIEAFRASEGRFVKRSPLLLSLAMALIIATATLAPIRGATELPERTTTTADQKQVNVTIYNADLALVHDRRRIGLVQGTSHIAWRDVSGALQPPTAILEDLTTPGAVRVDEQNFDFDLLRPQTVLDKFVGRDVTVVHEKPAPGTPARETARLLATNDGVILKYADRIETGLYESHIVFPSLPNDLRDRPTLTLELRSDTTATHELDLAYLTGGLGWAADYVGTVAADDTHVDLRGLVTLTNTTGTTFPNAHLQLVAGNVGAPPPAYASLKTIGRVAALDAPAPQVAEQNFFEYHLYTLSQPTTIANAQTKQVALLSAHRVPMRKTLEVRGSSFYYSTPSADLGTKIKVGVYVTFANKGGDLGIPLPGGIVRLYKNDTNGTSQYLGADRIDHTAKNEDVRLHVGDAFDVTASKKQMSFETPARCTYRSSYEVRIANAKAEPQDVLVVEPIPGVWTIEDESLPHTKTSSATATWIVHVPANGNVTLKYTAQARLCP